MCASCVSGPGSTMNGALRSLSTADLRYVLGRIALAHLRVRSHAHGQEQGANRDRPAIGHVHTKGLGEGQWGMKSIRV